MPRFRYYLTRTPDLSAAPKSLLEGLPDVVLREAFAHLLDGDAGGATCVAESHDFREIEQVQQRLEAHGARGYVFEEPDAPVSETRVASSPAPADRPSALAPAAERRAELARKLARTLRRR